MVRRATCISKRPNEKIGDCEQSTEKLKGAFRVTCTLSLSNETPIVGADWAADCTMQWFDILGSIDYNYAFFPDRVYCCS